MKTLKHWQKQVYHCCYNMQSTHFVLMSVITTMTTHEMHYFTNISLKTVQNLNGSGYHKTFLHITRLNGSFSTAVLQLAAFISTISCKSSTLFSCIGKVWHDCLFTSLITSSYTNIFPVTLVLSSNRNTSQRNNFHALHNNFCVYVLW